MVMSKPHAFNARPLVSMVSTAELSRPGDRRAFLTTLPRTAPWSHWRRHWQPRLTASYKNSLIPL